MFDLHPQPNKLILDKETLKLATNLYNNNHGKLIVLLQDLENDFSKNPFIKSRVKAEYSLGDISSVFEQSHFQLSFFGKVQKLNATKI